MQKQPSCNSRHETGQVDLACNPALQAFGPLPRPKMVVRQLPFFCEEQLYECLFDICEEAMAEDLDCSCASKLLRDSLSNIPIHPADAMAVVESWGDERGQILVAHEAPGYEHHVAFVEEWLRYLRSVWSPLWLVNGRSLRAA